jgi:phosphoglycerate dehydrogenase-like enzyme
MSTPMSIAIAAHLDSRATDLLRTALAADRVQWGSDPVEAVSFGDCEIVFGTIAPTALRRSPHLRWLQLESVGFEYYRGLADELAERGVVVTNLKGQFARPAAETAIGGLLSLYRGLNDLALAGSRHHWQSLEVRPRTTLLSEKRALVLGAGSIGTEVRRLLEAFHCDVTSFALRSPAAEIHNRSELDRELERADIVVNCLPSTAETDRLLDADRLQRFQPTAVFVNVGRGSVVDESALTEMLVSERLGGAVLDVTAQEPLAPDNALWAAPRTILTQHTGGGYADELADKARRFLANLARWRRGLPLHDVVDLQAGY